MTKTKMVSVVRNKKFLKKILKDEQNKLSRTYKKVVEIENCLNESTNVEIYNKTPIRVVRQSDGSIEAYSVCDDTAKCGGYFPEGKHVVVCEADGTFESIPVKSRASALRLLKNWISN